MQKQDKTQKQPETNKSGQYKVEKKTRRSKAFNQFLFFFDV